MLVLGVCTPLTLVVGIVAALTPPGHSIDRDHQPVPANTGQSLTEEFAESALDPSVWAPAEKRHDNGSFWSRDLVSVAEDELRLAGTGRNPTGAGNWASSVCANRQAAPNWYGLWEIRARFEPGTGYGIEFGLWPDTKSSTTRIGRLEVDIPDGSRNRILSRMPGLDGSMVQGTPVPGDFTGWHTYAVEWRSTFVTVSVDQKVIFDSATASRPVLVPATKMVLCLQIRSGPFELVPPPDASTPDRVVAHIDFVRYLP